MCEEFFKLALFLVWLYACRAAEMAPKDIQCDEPQGIYHFMPCCRFPDLFTVEIKEKCSSSESPPTIDACFIECFKNETQIIDSDYNLDVKKLTEYLEEPSNNAGKFLPMWMYAFMICQHQITPLKMSEDDMNAKRDLAAHQCCPNGEIFMSCVMRKTLRNCPTAYFNTSDECREAHEQLGNCRKI